MAFKDTYAKFLSLYLEQDAAQQPMDATQPEQASTTPPPPTKPQSQEEPDALPPEGYVDMVRMLAKALVMNVPAGSIDSLFTKPITRETATTMREALQTAISMNENYEDNPQRITNPHTKKFVDSINENNFMAKYKQLLNTMKKFSNDPKLG